MLLSCIMFITLLRRLGVGHMEKPYMLTYDLNSPGQKYEELRNVIKKKISNGYCNYWESSFLFRSSLTPSDMVNKLQPYLDLLTKIFFSFCH